MPHPIVASAILREISLFVDHHWTCDTIWWREAWSLVVVHNLNWQRKKSEGAGNSSIARRTGADLRSIKHRTKHGPAMSSCSRAEVGRINLSLGGEASFGRSKDTRIETRLEGNQT